MKAASRGGKFALLLLFALLAPTAAALVAFAQGSQNDVMGFDSKPGARTPAPASGTTAGTAAGTGGSDSDSWSRENIRARDTYTRDEIKGAMDGFFEDRAEELSHILDRAFGEHGNPTGFITGEEGGGAFIVGLRYGKGLLNLKNKKPIRVYWQGPSVGFDVGGSGGRVFTLVYNMSVPQSIFGRFPGVDGSLFIVGGYAMNYQRKGEIVLAPVRAGLGLRAGINVGYLHYTRQHHVNPF